MRGMELLLSLLLLLLLVRNHLTGIFPFLVISQVADLRCPSKTSCQATLVLVFTFLTPLFDVSEDGNPVDRIVQPLGYINFDYLGISLLLILPPLNI